MEYRVHAGALTEVWRGVDAQGRIVAVKLAGHTVEGGAAVRRLRAEYGLLKRFTHPSIVRPIACVDEPGYAALVTEYLPGGDLVSLAGAAARHWANAAIAILDALAALHAKTIVHRDVKAQNVMFDAAGRARLIDFGSAAAVGGPRSAAGTTEPHRYDAAGALDATDDVYAFAVLLYQLMCGKLPAAAVEAPLTTEQRARAPLAALEALVLRALRAGSPTEIGTLGDYRDGLESILAEEWERL